MTGEVGKSENVSDGFKSGREMGEWFNKMYALESFDNPNEIRPNADKHFQIIDWGGS